MKRSKWIAALVWLLCAAVLLSGALLVFHAGHACHDQACVLCPILEHCKMALLGVLAIAAAASLWMREGAPSPSTPKENRFDPEWTLVRRKVKLLN